MDYIDFPARHHCGTCLFCQEDRCDNEGGYRYQEQLDGSEDACGQWEDGR